MKTSYFTKIEDKYVFNLSLIFWHIFIAISTVAIVVCLAVFLWSVTPAAKKKVVKQPYPEKTNYPEPVKVQLGELNLEELKQIEAPSIEQIIPADSLAEIPTVVENMEGKKEYQASLDSLKLLIPPSKYSWEGEGYWTYPYGERFWTYYQQEKYRRWNISEEGTSYKLEASYKNSDLKTYLEKKQLLDAFIGVLKLLPEEKRLKALQYLAENVADNLSQNISTNKALAKLAQKLRIEDNTWIYQLSYFGKRNPSTGPVFIDYVSTIIENFDNSKKHEIVELLINAYYGYFAPNFAKQKESTDLFVPLIAQIKPDFQPKALTQYYNLYLSKNSERDEAIEQIDNEYELKVLDIENQYQTELVNSEMQFQNKTVKKAELRIKSLFGIGGGILIIVLIATLLVFLSIQRSVRKIEEKISSNTL